MIKNENFSRLKQSRKYLPTLKKSNVNLKGHNEITEKSEHYAGHWDDMIFYCSLSDRDKIHYVMLHIETVYIATLQMRYRFVHSLT